MTCKSCGFKTKTRSNMMIHLRASHPWKSGGMPTVKLWKPNEVHEAELLPEPPKEDLHKKLAIEILESSFLPTEVKIRWYEFLRGRSI